MGKINLKSIIVALIITIVGIILVCIDNISCVSVGCSLIASAVISILTALIVDREKINPLDEWGIDKIYSSRTERNRENDPYIDKAKYRVDGIAFGLTSFRNNYGKKVENCLKKGVNFQIITMNPESPHIEEREKEEEVVKGSIEKDINDMVSWANKLNNKGYKGSIIVKGYDCMTLDYYWRVDNKLFIGPYWYGYKSGDTITYKFNDKGKGFTQYTEYFDRIWYNKDMLKTLTEVEDIKPQKKKVKK
ncbi:MAG: hypothetical protein ACI4JM_06880 [Oscillospiraceae bacterium]